MKKTKFTKKMFTYLKPQNFSWLNKKVKQAKLTKAKVINDLIDSARESEKTDVSN